MTDLLGKLKAFHQTLGNSGVKSSPAPVTQSPDPTPPPTAGEPNPVLEKLRKLPGIVTGRELAGHLERKAEHRAEYLASLGGREVANDAGAYWLREKSFNYQDLHEDPREIDGNLLARLGADPDLANLSPHDLLFLDTETTGLSGGAGTVAFLVGVGWCERERFVVRQYFMRDYDEEPAMLHDLGELLGRFEALATFNGKSFDGPLLQSRFVMQRMPISVEDWPHLDLLFSARRLWKARCRSCALENLELMVLGQSEREVDIPSEEIPGVYFDFVRGRRVERIRPVLEHNVQDIVSLPMLAARAAGTLWRPEASHPLDCWSVARWHYMDRDYEGAIPLFERALSKKLPLGERFTALRLLGAAQRRVAGRHAASEVWRLLLAPPFPPHPMPWIELAKFHEHTEKSYDVALEHVGHAEQALLDNRAAETMDAGPDAWPDCVRLTDAAFRNTQEDLERRRARLEMKSSKEARKRRERDG